MPSPPTTPLNPTATPTPIQPTAPTTFPLTPLTPSTPPTLPPLHTLQTLYTPLKSHLHTTLSTTTSLPPSPTIPSISLAHSLAIARLRPVDRFLAQLDRDIQDFKRWLDHRDEYPVSGGGKRGSGSEATEGANGDKKMEELEVLRDAVGFHGEAMAELEGAKTGLRVWCNEGKMGVLERRRRRSEGDGGGGALRGGEEDGDEVGKRLGLSKDQVGWLSEERVAKMVETQGVVEEVRRRIGVLRGVVEGGRRRRTV